MDVSEFVSMQEAVEISGYTRTMLALLCRTGKLPGAQKLGGRWLIPRKALEGYVPDPPGPKPGSKRKGAGTVKAILEEALAQAREREAASRAAVGLDTGAEEPEMPSENDV